MIIVLNGERHEAAAGTTVLALLEDLRLVPGRVAVEWNSTVLRRESFARSTLREGDRVEVVQFVGGG